MDLWLGESLPFSNHAFLLVSALLANITNIHLYDVTWIVIFRAANSDNGTYVIDPTKLMK